MRIDDPSCHDTDTNFAAGVCWLTHLGAAGVKCELSLYDGTAGYCFSCLQATDIVSRCISNSDATLTLKNEEKL